MAKFQYKLQSVLDIKEKLESQEKIAFGIAMTKLLEEQEVLQKLMIQKAGYDKQARKLLEGNINLRDIHTCRQAVETMKTRIRAQMLEVHNAEKQLDIVRRRLNEDGFSLGQKAVDEKSNEITAIPELLEKLQIKGQIITIDAMGTQTAIVEKIRGKRADYVLALKGNQGRLYEEVKEYFADEELRRRIEKSGNYKKTREKAHSQIEIREYYQTEDTRWLEQKKEWKGLKSIAMERKRIEKNGEEKTEYRYYISSLKENIEIISRAIRGHWSIESMHWQLDVTFREDANATLDKMSAQNLNIIRKWSLSILKMMELTKQKLSMKKKRFVISLSPIKYLEEVLGF